MRGHEQLIAMRREGAVPDWVFIDIEEYDLECWRDWEKNTPEHAHLLIGLKDRRPDMRCVTDLPCLVQGEDRKRVFAVRDACIKVGARRVIAAVTVSRRAEFKTIEVTDTAGIEDFIEGEVEHG